MKKIFYFYNSFSFLLVSFIFFGCSLIDFNRINQQPNVVYQSEAAQRGIEIDKLKKEIFDINNKTIAVLPIYTEVNSTGDDLTVAETELKPALESFKLTNSNYKYLTKSDFTGKDLDDLILFQQYLYQISLMEKTLSLNIQKITNTDLLLTVQVDSWPTKKDEKVAAQFRLIDAKRGLLLWHGGDSSKINIVSERNGKLKVIFERISKTMLSDLK